MRQEVGGPFKIFSVRTEVAGENELECLKSWSISHDTESEKWLDEVDEKVTCQNISNINTDIDETSSATIISTSPVSDQVWPIKVCWGPLLSRSMDATHGFAPFVAVKEHRFGYEANLKKSRCGRTKGELVFTPSSDGKDYQRVEVARRLDLTTADRSQFRAVCQDHCQKLLKIIDQCG